MNPVPALALLPALLLIALPCEAAKPRLNDSGVVLCRDTDLVDSTACADTGQDGEFGRDVTSAKPKDGRLGFSFVKVCNNGEPAGQGSCPAKPKRGTKPTQWGCTQDKITGLTWELKTDNDGPGDKDRRFSNRPAGLPTDAITYAAEVNAAGMCGATDWRVPTLLDLHSVVDYGVPAPGASIDEAYFPNTLPTEGNAWYWTAMVDGGADGLHALTWDFNSGVNQLQTLGAPASVRLVRGKALEPGPGRWVLLGEEAYDKMTGLIWQRCLAFMLWNGSSCVGAPAQPLSWHGALTAVKNYADSAGLPWRLPSIKELASIVDDSHDPAFDPTVFPPGFLGLDHWSSTPVMGVPDRIWGVSGGYGNVVREGTIKESCTSGACVIRLVRDGPP